MNTPDVCSTRFAVSSRSAPSCCCAPHPHIHRQGQSTRSDDGNCAEVAQVDDGLAHANHANGQHEQVRQHWQHTLNILINFGTDHTEDIEANAPNIRAHLTKIVPVD